MVTQVVWPATGDTSLHPTPYSFHQHGDTGCLAGHRWYCSSPYTIQLPSTWWHRLSGRPKVILQFILHHTAFDQYVDTGCLAGHRWYCSSPYTIQLPSTWWHRLSGRPQVILQFTLHHTASINMVTQVVWPATGDTAVHPTHTASINMVTQVVWTATGDTAVHPTPYSFHQHGDTGCLARHMWYCSSPYTIQLPSTWWHRLSGPPQVKLQFTLHHTASIKMVIQVVWPATCDTALHPTPYSFHQHGDTGCLAGHRWYCTSPYTIQLPSTWWYRLSGRPQVILQFTLHYTASINMVTQVVWPAKGDTAVHLTPYSFWSIWWHRLSGRPQVIVQFTLHHTASINMVTSVVWPATGDTAVHSSPYSFHQHGDTGCLAGHRWYCSSSYTIQLPSIWWHRFSGRPQVILQFTLHPTASINMVTQVVWPATGYTALDPTPYSFHQHGDTGFLAGHRWYCSSPYTI